MSNITNMNPSMVRVDYSRADRYIYPEPPKLTFWQKLGRGLGKFMSFAGPIGAAVTAIALPGIGLPIAAGLYGLGRFSQDQLYKANVKDQIAAASQPQPVNISLPGLFEVAPLQAGDAATEFIAPSSLEPRISDVVIERNAAQQQEIHNFGSSL